MIPIAFDRKLSQLQKGFFQVEEDDFGQCAAVNLSLQREMQPSAVVQRPTRIFLYCLRIGNVTFVSIM